MSDEELTSGTEGEEKERRATSLFGWEVPEGAEMPTEEELDAEVTRIIGEIREKGGKLGEVYADQLDAARKSEVLKTLAGRMGYQDIIEEVKKWLSFDWLKLSEDQIKGWMDDLAEHYHISEKATEVLKGIIGSTPGLQVIWMVLLTIVILFRSAGIITDQSMGHSIQYWNREMRPSMPSPGEALDSAFLSSDLASRVWDLLRRHGYTDSDIELVFASRYQRLPMDMIQEIYFRTGKPDEWAVGRLRELGLTDDRIAELMSVWPRIPDIARMVYYMGREAYEEPLINRFGLRSEMPQQLIEEAKKRGFPAEDAEREWIAHWEHPDFRLVLEMLHRGFISAEAVEDWFKLREIPPYWREAMRKVSHTLITRVDLRRIRALGMVDDDYVEEYFGKLGYAPEDAKRMRDFYSVYTMESGRDLTMSQITKAYKVRRISREEAADELQWIGYDEYEADFLLTGIDYERETELEEARIATIEAQFKGRFIDSGQARRLLTELALDADQISYHMEKWLAEIIGDNKVPSKTDLDKFLKGKIIDEAVYREEMKRLGYADQYIDWYYQAATAGKGKS